MIRSLQALSKLATTNAPWWCVLIIVAAGCAPERRQDIVCWEYPRYDGPPLSVWVGTFEADKPACAELGRVAWHVLATELARSGAIRLQNRLHSDAPPSSTSIAPEDTQCTIHGVIMSYRVTEETACFGCRSGARLVECTVRVEVVNRRTGAAVNHYGQATRRFEATFPRSAIASHALRAAIHDCWTSIIRSLRAIDPGEHG